MKTTEDDGQFFVFYTVRTERGRHQRLTDGPHTTEQQAEKAMKNLRAQHGPAAWVHGHIEERAT